MKKIIFNIFALFLSTGIFGQIPFKLVQVANGYIKPLDLQNSGDERLFVVSQPGVIYILDSMKTKLPVPFLDINAKVIDSGNERGLLGLAFHPNYKQNGYFYVNYSRNNDGYTTISRFKVSADPNIADTTEQILLTVPQPYSNHNGGCMQFGPDGYLYIGLGDGGSGGDPQANAQNPKKYLGKMLRIDVDNGTPYGIPPDNPFINNPDTLAEIWALGLRNPWRYSFDKLTGDFYIADVGQDIWEEVDFQPAGAKGGLNYGWRCFEGNATYNQTGCGPASGYVFPIHVHKHPTDGCSITGGYVYRGNKYPGLYGKYLFTDYCTGIIWALYRNNSGKWTESKIADLNNNDFVSFGQDKYGELYIVASATGKIYKIEMDCQDIPVSYAITDACKDSLNGQIQLNSGNTLSYQWSTGDTSNIVSNIGPGVYSVLVVDSLFCGKIIDSLIVGETKVTATLSQINDSTLIINNPTNFINIQWYYNGNPISGANDTMYVPKKSGVYSAEFFYTSNCRFTTDSINYILTGTKDKIKGIDISIWPNPVKDNITINVMGVAEDDYILTVFNNLGQQILIKKLSIKQTELNLSSLPPGMYAIEVRQADKRKLIKFIKN